MDWALVTWDWDGDKTDISVRLFPSWDAAETAAWSWLVTHNVFGTDSFDTIEEAVSWWLEEGMDEDFTIGCRIVEVSEPGDEK